MERSGIERPCEESRNGRLDKAGERPRARWSGAESSGPAGKAATAGWIRRANARERDGAKRNRACALRGGGQQKPKRLPLTFLYPLINRSNLKGAINQTSLMAPFKLCCPLDQYLLLSIDCFLFSGLFIFPSYFCRNASICLPHELSTTVETFGM